ncbi:uncharacterized protein A1O5_02580 [Cladophialophora psammophila CBS 110553]|uniref:Transmembrane protein n=1 Tax=Cladophialophora psammophila CBS 110553 TaxID=1182543 RepID=W9XVJ5_9EURO|nr:uncharacterized protein A1O5_02580 [Cladophialophora psammophila CBS 110553]EXJ74284.1 hypothetical protein A1O5_02580 [Cladophialophora psammophila CBS 110553]
MSSSPVNIPLGPVPPISSTPADPTMSWQTPTPNRAGSGNTAQNTTSHGLSSSTTNTTSNLTSPATAAASQTSRRLLWQKMRRASVRIAKCAFAIIGSIIAYISLRAAMWSAVKDYRDDCRSQNQTYGHVSGACAKALRAGLSSPLGLSLFLSEPKSDQHRYPPRDIVEHQETVGEVHTVVKWVLSILAIFILLCIDEIYGPNSSSLGSYTPGGHNYPPEGNNCLWILRRVTARMILALSVILIWLARLLRRRATWTVILVFLVGLVVPVNLLAQVLLTTLTILMRMVTLFILVAPVIVVVLVCLVILVVALTGSWLERRLLPRLWFHAV